MAIEIEKKYRLDKKRLVDLTAKLRELGAEFRGEAFEENFLHRGGDLEARGAVLRLRKTGGLTLLTYKQRIDADSDIKHRIEYETEIADAEAIERIIESLGYELSVIYEKRRNTWHLRDVEIVLDELPFGLFMEIEGEVDAIERAEKELEINDLEVEPRGYPRLAVKYGKQVDNRIEARFEEQLEQA